MSAFKIVSLALLQFLTSSVFGLKCPEDAISKLVVCYYRSETSLDNFNICNCTHIIFTNAVEKTENNTISGTEDAIRFLEEIKVKKEKLSSLFTLETKQEEISKILKSKDRSQQLIDEISKFLRDSQFDGVELDFEFDPNDGVSRESYADFVKNLSKALSSSHPRIKREGYDVFEKLQDDITTASYTTQTPKNSTSKPQSVKEKSQRGKENKRKIRENKDADYLTLEEAINAEFSGSGKQNTLNDTEENSLSDKKFLIFVRLSVKPEIIAKKYDLKLLSRYADILTVPTHDVVNSNYEYLTYHPSRLMGLSDILNTDSILDFLTGMGALKSKMVISLPATVLKFQLKDENKNTPRSPSVSKPQAIDQSQLCALFNKKNWTIERDDDLTAPYAFSGKTWLAFEDEISINIKGKYILLRELAGGAIYPIDSDLNDGLCTNHTGSGGYLTGILHKNFESLERKPRALVLESLQDEIHDTAITNLEAGVKLSEYRIVRVVDHSGAVHVIRKNTKTQFECSRQGYFSHPLGCNKFYRCVKFDQYSDEFTVFEYDCPVGLAFDERWEVCVWPGSLPHGAPCTGSSEIAPVPRSHYQCPNHEGYYADPENCRWFFACLDHVRDGITPLTAYEFRCPFGLVFSEEKLACDWPWLVGSCGNRGAAGYLNVNSVAGSGAIHSTTFINGGNLEASFGQFGNINEEASFAGFGKKFGSISKESNAYSAQKTYQGAPSAGFGYITSQFDDNNNRAAFAAFPDYEISGGRIFNKGGVVLDQNVVGISGGASGGVVGNLNVANGVESYSKASEIIHPVGVIHNVPNIQISKLEPTLEISNKNTFQTSEHSFGASFQNSASTPKPFSVRVPSVQINEEKVSEYLGHSKVEPLIPQTIKFKTTPQTETTNIQFIDNKQLNGEQYSVSHGFTGSSSTASIPAVTPAAEIFKGGLQHDYNTLHLQTDVSLSTPLVSFSTTPKTETHRFGEINFKTNGFSNKASLNGATINVPGTELFKHNSGISYDSNINQQNALPIPTVTSKLGIQTFEHVASGLASGYGQPFAPTATPAVSFSQQGYQTSSKIPTVQLHTLSEGQSVVSKSIPAGQAGVHYEAPVVTGTQSVHTVGGKSGFEADFSTVSSKPTLVGLVHSSIDEKVFNEIKFKTPQSSFAVPVVTPRTEFQTFSKTSDNEHSGLISEKTPLAKPKLFQTFSYSGINSNDASGKSGTAVSYNVPLVTPKPNVNILKHSVEQESGVSVTPIVSFDSLKVTSGIQNGFEQKKNAKVLKDFSRVTYKAPTISPQNNINLFDQSNFEQGKISYSSPIFTPEKETYDFVQPHDFVTPKSDVKFSQTGIPVQPIQSAFGQQHSYSSSAKQSGNKFVTVQPFETLSSTPKLAVFEKTQVFLPKVEQTQSLTEFHVKQQPVVSIGTTGLNRIDHTLSTPTPFAFSGDTFSHGSVNNNNFKASYVQLQQVPVTTPAPVVSITPATLVTYEKNQQSPHSLNVNSIPTSPRPIYSQSETKVDFETHGPALHQTVANVPANVLFDEKQSNFEEEIKSFAPVAHVTASTPLTYEQGRASGFGYLGPVTPKTEIPGSKFQTSSQILSTQFGTTERNQILLQELAKPVGQSFEYLNIKTLDNGKPAEFIRHPAPEFRPQLKLGEVAESAVSTVKPFTPEERLVDLEISKSIEINPSQIFKGNEERLLPNVQGKSIEIQQQPLHLVSQKTFTAKQIIQPFYEKQNDEILRAQINHIPENKYQEQFVLQPQIDIQTTRTNILEEKQYLSPPVTSKPVSYSTAQTIKIQQPLEYFGESENVAPEVPVSETSKTETSFGGNKEILFSDVKENKYLPPSVSTISTVSVKLEEDQRPPKVIPSRINLLLPTSTQVPFYASSQTERSQVQNHENFHSQKIKTYESTPIENIFIQTTPKPQVGDFGTSLTFQHGSVESPAVKVLGSYASNSGIKYAINPNIAIPEPSREYILAQNGYTTVAPEISTVAKTGSQIQSTTAQSSRGRFTGSTYLPPQVSSRRKPSKTTILSIGNVDEEEAHDENVQNLFDKYSQGFGQVISGKNARFQTKIIKGNGEGEIEIDKGGSSTVRYEVSSVAPRQRSRGRQYHGGITAGVQSTNKNEEYEINGNREGQRSNDEQDNAEISKTSIDLKNLKLDKNKKTVIVVSQVSDADPVLVGKLAGQCSCQSNLLELRSKGKKSKAGSRRKSKIPQGQRQHSIISNEYLPPFGGSQSAIASETFARDEASSAGPQAKLGKALKHGISSLAEQTLVSSSTTASPEFVSSTILSSLGPNGVLSITPKTVYAREKVPNKKKQFRGRTRYLPSASLLSEDSSSVPLLSPVPASEIASTFDYSVIKGFENEINDGSASKVVAGAAFDRYGPGGWRGFDEALQGSIDCKRPGLFRHPKYCNKFYACNYDPWKERYTLHVFNCPIHLTYDSSISACNWPVRGPACADDNLLV